jgi:hypothetical protein
MDWNNRRHPRGSRAMLNDQMNKAVRITQAI